MSGKFCVILTTFGSRIEADSFAGNVVSRRLAACVNIFGPMVSTYWWKGRREKSEEFLALAKTSETRVEELVAELKRMHSYELPEVTVLKSPEAESTLNGWCGKHERKSHRRCCAETTNY
ncbi:MAG: divalent-cation tolerance protein CutA [Aigarchaeota archaeon]|nr:divalent-cation tolerance protein CutA [Aigarchaeota archaeon]